MREIKNPLKKQTFSLLLLALIFARVNGQDTAHNTFNPVSLSTVATRTLAVPAWGAITAGSYPLAVVEGAGDLTLLGFSVASVFMTGEKNLGPLPGIVLMLGHRLIAVPINCLSAHERNMAHRASEGKSPRGRSGKGSFPTRRRIGFCYLWQGRVPILGLSTVFKDNIGLDAGAGGGEGSLSRYDAPSRAWQELFIGTLGMAKVSYEMRISRFFTFSPSASLRAGNAWYRQLRETPDSTGQPGPNQVLLDKEDSYGDLSLLPCLAFHPLRAVDFEAGFGFTLLYGGAFDRYFSEVNPEDRLTGFLALRYWL